MRVSSGGLSLASGAFEARGGALIASTTSDGGSGDVLRVLGRSSTNPNPNDNGNAGSLVAALRVRASGAVELGESGVRVAGGGLSLARGELDVPRARVRTALHVGLGAGASSGDASSGDSGGAFVGRRPTTPKQSKQSSSLLVEGGGAAEQKGLVVHDGGGALRSRFRHADGGGAALEVVADLPSGLARGADVLLLRARAVGDGDVVDAPDAIARVMEESHTSTTTSTTTTTAAESVSSEEEGRDGNGGRAGGGVRLLRALAPDGADAFEIGASGATTVHAGGLDVRSGGVRVRAGGLEIGAGGLSVDGGLTLRSGALTLAGDNGSLSDADAQNGGGGGGGNKAGGFVVRDGGVSARHTAPGAPPLRAHAASATFAGAVLSLEAAPSASGGFSFIEVRRGSGVGGRGVSSRGVIARSL